MRGVESDVAFDAAAVQGAEHFREFGEGETAFGAGGEMGEAEVDGIGSSVDGGAELWPVAGGGFYFRLSANYYCRAL
ncbi:MAG: hypothetical protein WDO18_05515 [Acidobacteriota bacterium]